MKRKIRMCLRRNTPGRITPVINRLQGQRYSSNLTTIVNAELFMSTGKETTLVGGLHVAIEVEVLEPLAGIPIAALDHRLKNIRVGFENRSLTKGIGKAITLLHIALLTLFV